MKVSNPEPNADDVKIKAEPNTEQATSSAPMETDVGATEIGTIVKSECIETSNVEIKPEPMDLNDDVADDATVMLPKSEGSSNGEGKNEAA
eukprot:CAMPEP_0117577160 /NCGR_PEP_ID=MMETSP0784-20121206/63251_1 /TAXON_ID=39447 /ORGANISM="" /LENGTH=90 /DNA_ID=CAMNT_0005376597 /DNA_START=1 /DNA_END=269 /DNA_ORIENTATION=-